MLKLRTTHHYPAPVPAPAAPPETAVSPRSADFAMAELGCRPEVCGRCGGRVYVFEGALGPFRCSRTGCAEAS